VTGSGPLPAAPVGEGVRTGESQRCSSPGITRAPRLHFQCCGAGVSERGAVIPGSERPVLFPKRARDATYTGESRRCFIAGIARAPRLHSQCCGAGVSERGAVIPGSERPVLTSRAQMRATPEVLNAIAPITHTRNSRCACPRWLPRRLKVEAGLRVETARCKFLESVR
jgi:hypothetical protein